MKRRNQKKLTLDQSAIRELKSSDFERTDGAALSSVPQLAAYLRPVDC